MIRRLKLRTKRRHSVYARRPLTAEGIHALTATFKHIYGWRFRRMLRNEIRMTQRLFRQVGA